MHIKIKEYNISIKHTAKYPFVPKAFSPNSSNVRTLLSSAISTKIQLVYPDIIVINKIIPPKNGKPICIAANGRQTKPAFIMEYTKFKAA